MSQIVTRFAPSPTGALHIGGVRTALYSFLYAQQHAGRFHIRIEDTDQERSHSSSLETILEGLAWLGLTSDEHPVFQSQRLERYQEVLDRLLASGHAYRCYCSKERLEALRTEQLAAQQKPRYDGKCRSDTSKKSDNLPYVIRFRNPDKGHVLFQDLVKGTLKVENSELDDLILQRSDGFPTYNFSVVVDDWDMGITHVIRGDDHISNTWRQINIYQALGATLPKFAHLPMILGDDGKRLSKRHGALSVLEYRQAGYLPEALLNYLVRLGWSYGDQEIFSLDEMITLFQLSAVNRAPCAFDLKKLTWLNQHYLKNMPVERLTKDIIPLLEQHNITADERLHDILILQRARSKTVCELASQIHYFFQDQISYDPTAAAKHLDAHSQPILAASLAALSKITWTLETIQTTLRDIMTAHHLKTPQLAQPLRVACTGTTNSPSIDATLHLLGQSSVLTRLQDALIWIEQKGS